MEIKALFMDKTDIKVFILSLLSGIVDPLNYATIQDIVCRKDRVNAFDFAECFSQLEELGHIISDEGFGERVYQISPVGKEVAAELQSSIAEPILRAAEVEASRLLAHREAGVVVDSFYEEKGPCHFVVTCKIKDKQGDILSLSYRVSNRSTAEKMVAHCKTRPEVMVQGLISVMTGDVDYLFD